MLDKVLNCPNLPTLPTVAVELLDLTRDPDAELSAIGDLVEKDAALASKVLRTVNSTYYGLAQPCPTIRRALPPRRRSRRWSPNARWCDRFSRHWPCGG